MYSSPWLGHLSFSARHGWVRAPLAGLLDVIRGLFCNVMAVGWIGHGGSSSPCDLRAVTGFPDAKSEAKRHSKPSRAWPGSECGWVCGHVWKAEPVFPSAVPV